MTWAKGHATQEHIDKGILTTEEKKRNEEADGYADRGREEHTRNDVNTKAAQQRTQIAMLMQTMMLKVWAKRLELINEEEQRIANEDSEHYELEQESANITELEALFSEAAAEESSISREEEQEVNQRQLRLRWLQLLQLRLLLPQAGKRSRKRPRAMHGRTSTLLKTSRSNLTACSRTSKPGKRSTRSKY